MSTFNCVVGVPSGGSWNAQFGVDLVNMFSTFTAKRVGDYKAQSLRLVNVRSSILSKNRLDLVKAAKELKATHLLFIDSDQTFPADLPHRLAAWGKQLVAANCVTKTLPASPTARAKDEDPRGRPVYSDPGMTGLEEVWRVGTGVMLIDLAVFEHIGMGVWDMKYLPEANTYQGEDWSFCAACEEASIPIYVDHGLSQRIGHVGLLEFTHDYVGELQPSSE